MSDGKYNDLLIADVKDAQKDVNIRIRKVRSNRKYISLTAIFLKDHNIDQVEVGIPVSLQYFESSLYYSDISHTGGIFNIFKSNDVLMLNSTDARIDVSDLI